MGLQYLIARIAYNVSLWLALPLYLVRLWRRGAKEPLYRHRIMERLGFYKRTLRPDRQGVQPWPVVWIHAVSLGEMQAAKTLIAAMRQHHPEMRLVLTCSTHTGMEAGRELVGEGDVQTWLPFDTAWSTRSFMRRARPTIGLVMETEVWPNLMRAAARKKVPMVLANARLSQRSLDKGSRFATLLRPAVASFDVVLAQSLGDAQRLREAGARDVLVCGNLKFDVTPPPKLTAKGLSWRALMSRSVVLMSSSRDGEEAQLLDAWAREPAPRPLLLVVPRHPQRFDEVAALIEQRGFRLKRRSVMGDIPSPGDDQVDVWLGDSMREMPMYYAMSDVALLGGSFGTYGGQNLIEAAACGCPLVMGLHTYNFAESSELALQARAAVRVSDMRQGVEQAVNLARDPLRNEWVERALRFASVHRGATDRMVERITPLVAQRRSSGR
jgi:3-deoxy-D-manno-octulosonic-acid transferase